MVVLVVAVVVIEACGSHIGNTTRSVVRLGSPTRDLLTLRQTYVV